MFQIPFRYKFTDCFGRIPAQYVFCHELFECVLINYPYEQIVFHKCHSWQAWKNKLG